MRTRLAAALLVALAALNSGCGGPQTAPLSGKVTYKGKPLTVGTVTVWADGDRYGVGAIGNDGSYTIPDAPVGTVKIAVSVPDFGGGVQKKPGEKRPRDDDKDKSAPDLQRGKTGGKDEDTGPPAVLIPAKYADPNTSGLTGVVSPNAPVHNIDIL